MPVHQQVLSIFSQVLNGFRSVYFSLSNGFEFSALDVLLGLAVVVIGCKLCWSILFEKRPFIANNANFERDAMLKAQYDIKQAQQDQYNRKVAIYANNLRQEIEAKRDIRAFKRKVFFDKARHFFISKEV